VYVELRHPFRRRCNEANQNILLNGKAHPIARKNFRQKVTPLFGEWMWSGDPYARVKAGTPHENDLIEAASVVFKQACGNAHVNVA
jgi:hypothetical protein